MVKGFHELNVAAFQVGEDAREGLGLAGDETNADIAVAAAERIGWGDLDALEDHHFVILGESFDRGFRQGK